MSLLELCPCGRGRVLVRIGMSICKWTHSCGSRHALETEGI